MFPKISISPSVAAAREVERTAVLIDTAPPATPVPPVVFMSLPADKVNEPAAA